MRGAWAHSRPSTRSSSVLAAPLAVGAGTKVRGFCCSVKRWNARLPAPLPSTSGWMRICLLSPWLAGATLALIRTVAGR
ncbi:hypothetical protein D3C72_1117850 [compost metagenome]